MTDSFARRSGRAQHRTSKRRLRDRRCPHCARAEPAPGAKRARPAKPGHFVARRALFFAPWTRFVVLRPSCRVAEDVLADDAEGLATAAPDTDA